MTIVETSFLVPIREDRDVGNGRLHPAERWNYFREKLFEEFGGYTIAPGNYLGCYTDPDTHNIVSDQSRKYILALPTNEVQKLRRFLRKEAVIFKQKTIYLQIGGKVEFISLRK
jgi:hypothetical protein